MTKVTSTVFVNIIMAVILFNSILLGVEIDASSKLGQEDIPSWFAVVNAAQHSSSIHSPAGPDCPVLLSDKMII